MDLLLAKKIVENQDSGLLLERSGPRGHHRLTAIGLLATGP